MKGLYLLCLLALVLGVSATASAQGNKRTGVVALEQAGRNGQGGRAVLVENGDGTTTIRIRLLGRPNDASLPVSIQVGDCFRGAEVVHKLNAVVSNRSETTVKQSPERVISTGRFLAVHRPDDSPEPVACARLDYVTHAAGNGEGPFPIAGESTRFEPEAGQGGDAQGSADGVQASPSDPGMGGGDASQSGQTANLPNTGAGGDSGATGSFAMLATLLVALVTGSALLLRRALV